MSPTFQSLRNRNYRLYATGAVVSNVGTWMQRIAQDWLVLQLTHNSGVALGVTTGLQFLPMLLLAPFAGTLADRYSKRHVLIVTQASMAVLGAVLGLLDVTGVVQVGQVYVLALLLGVAAAVDAPARQSFVIEMVGRDDLPNAVGLNSASFNLGRVIGPALAGLLIVAVGTGPVFLINAASFGAVIFALKRMRVSELSPVPHAERGPGQVLDGIRYVRARPDLLMVMVIVFFVGTFGLNFQMTSALMATEVFHKGAGEYGLLGSILAIGSLSGALLAARRGRPRLRLIVVAAVAFGVVEVAAGLMPSYVTFVALLIPLGLCQMTLLNSANATMQLGVDPVMRGRVMALYMAVLMGGTPIGAPLVGALAETFGARWSLIAGGLISAAAALVAGGLLARRDGLQLRGELFGAPGRTVPEEELADAVVQR
ncbi:MAG: MFS transporter [Actinomycetes bacterium]